MDNKFNYIIGDIHGCYEELIELEKIIKEHAKKENSQPFIISCGDLIDRGPYSKEVIEHFMKGNENKTHLAIMGNHEFMMLQYLENYLPEENKIKLPKFIDNYIEMYKKDIFYRPFTPFVTYCEIMNKIWLDVGGKETLISFNSEKEIKKDVIDFLINLPLYYEGKNFFVTHAIPNKNDLEKIKLFDTTSDSNDFIEIKKSIGNIIWNRKIPNEKISEKINISGYSTFKEVNILEKQNNALQIDTGCVYGNKLTAYCPETKSFLFVNAKNKYRDKKLL